jgi:hypothetical protein
VALHPDLLRTAVAECYAAAQNAEDSTIKQAYLELIQAWRVLADEADRLRSRPAECASQYRFAIGIKAPAVAQNNPLWLPCENSLKCGSDLPPPWRSL